MKTYNGHSSWNQWNALLWLGSDEQLENTMRQFKDASLSNTQIFKNLENLLVGSKTPDGATITSLALRAYIKGY